MPDGNLKVKLCKHWNGFPPGHVFLEMPRGMANVLIERGFGKNVIARKKNVSNKVNNGKRSGKRAD